MRHLLRRITLLAAALATANFAQHAATAGDGCCAHCGGADACHKVCRLVNEDKKVPVTCWGCKCEDFCVGGPSTPGCKNCEEVCDFCDETKADDPYSQAKRFVWTEWCPSWAKVHTKKKLMKRTVTMKVPSFKWVVEDLCEGCAAKTAAVDVTLEYDVLPATATVSDGPAQLPQVMPADQYRPYLR